MANEKRLVGEVKRDGTLVYELTMVDCSHGRQAEANRWEADVSSCMSVCTQAEREQIAERIRVAVNAYEPMRTALAAVKAGIEDAGEAIPVDGSAEEIADRCSALPIRRAVLLACLAALRAADYYRSERPKLRAALLEAIDEIEAGMGGPRDATEDEVALLGRLCEAHGPEEYRRFAKIWLRRGER